MLELLIVDDDEMLRESLGMLFRREGFAVTTAASGEAAIEAAGAQSFDIVISDVRMPGADGVDVVREVRRLQPDTHLVLITGYASEETTLHALRLRVDDYFRKPFDMRTFVERIRAIGRGRLRVGPDPTRGLRRFADLLREASPEWGNHAWQVAAVCAAAGEDMGLDEVEVAALRLAGLFHDLRPHGEGRACLPGVADEAEGTGVLERAASLLGPGRSDAASAVFEAVVARFHGPGAISCGAGGPGPAEASAQRVLEAEPATTSGEAGPGSSVASRGMPLHAGVTPSTGMSPGAEVMVSRDDARLQEAVTRAVAVHGPTGGSAPTGPAMVAPVAPLAVQTLGDLRITVHGAEVSRADWESASARNLFLFLLCDRGRRVSEDRIIDAFWPGGALERARRALKTAVYRIRKALKAAEVVLTGERYYQFNAAVAHKWDFDDLERGAVRARALETAQNPAAALREWTVVASLYRGPFLDGMEGDWLEPMRDLACRLAVESRARAAALLLASGDATAAARQARAVIALDRSCEEGHATLVAALGALGRRDDAVRAYHSAVDALQRTLGLAPGPDLVRAWLEATGG